LVIIQCDWDGKIIDLRHQAEGRRDEIIGAMGYWGFTEKSGASSRLGGKVWSLN